MQPAVLLKWEIFSEEAEQRAKSDRLLGTVITRKSHPLPRLGTAFRSLVSHQEHGFVKRHRWTYADGVDSGVLMN